MIRALKSHSKTKPVGDLNADSTIDSDFLLNLMKSFLADASSRCTKYQLTDYTRDVATLIKRFNAEGLGFLTRTVPTLIQGLFTYLESGVVVFPGFKLQAGKPYPRFLKGIFHIINSERSTVLEQAYALDCIYQFASACKKLHGPFNENELDKQYIEFCDVDDSLNAVFDDLDEEGFQTLQLARSYFIKDFCSFEIDATCMPRPGPGATYSKTPLSERYAPHRMFSQHQAIFPTEEWFYSHPWDVVGQSRAYLHLKQTEKCTPRARMLYVPKVVGKARGICIEENESQWLQQALATGLRKYASHTVLRGHVEFNDQNVNGLLAHESSLTRENATIDMSEASDRIPRDIVSWITQDNPDLHNALMCLSTRVIDRSPQNNSGPKTKALNKYAPMGSGLCFPVMGLMHYYLIKAIVMRVHGSDITDNLYVYGDDIVLPRIYVQSVFDKLPLYGMKLNRTKSFARSHFRESCGYHAYKGMVVTPVFLRKIPITEKVDTLVSTLATEALLFRKGLFHASGVLREKLESIYGKLPYVTEDSPLVGWKRPARDLDSLYPFTSEKRLISRWNRVLQCREFRVRVLIDRSESNPTLVSAQCEGLLRWFTTRAEESSIFRSAPTDYKIGHRWLSSAQCMPCTGR